jgi:hypothetical protein
MRGKTAAFGLSMVVLSTGCGVKFGDSSSGGGGTTDAGVSRDGAADAAAGVACGRDVQTGLVLCAGVSTCPNVFVDPDAFPGCGFMPGSLQLQCLCAGDSVCPMGKPKTCADVKALLASSNVVLVCSQVSEGNCKPIQ